MAVHRIQVAWGEIGKQIVHRKETLTNIKRKGMSLLLDQPMVDQFGRVLRESLQLDDKVGDLTPGRRIDPSIPRVWGGDLTAEDARHIQISEYEESVLLSRLLDFLQGVDSIVTPDLDV